MTARRRAAAVAGSALGVAALGVLAGCGDPVDVIGFDVALSNVSDCRQTGVNVQCAQPAELDDIVDQGRWIVEERPTGEFILTLEDGRTLTGLSFPNDGEVQLVVAPFDGRPTTGCAGEGGVCYFARQTLASTDTSLNCARQDSFAVIFHLLEDVVAGQAVTSFQTAEDCSTPSAAVVVVGIDGARADEPSRAREVYAP